MQRVIEKYILIVEELGGQFNFDIINGWMACKLTIMELGIEMVN